MSRKSVDSNTSDSLSLKLVTPAFNDSQRTSVIQSIIHENDNTESDIIDEYSHIDTISSQPNLDGDQPDTNISKMSIRVTDGSNDLLHSDNSLNPQDSANLFTEMHDSDDFEPSAVIQNVDSKNPPKDQQQLSIAIPPKNALKYVLDEINNHVDLTVLQ
jgi:hypothetical protein